MSSTEGADHDPRAARLPVRSLTVVGSHGEQLVNVSVFCPRHERSAALAECEACERFHALHFDAATRATAVVCGCEAALPAPAEAGAPRDAGAGPIDPRTPIAAIMTKAVVSVGPETELDDVADLLERHSIGGVPVVDAFCRPIGVVSRADVLRAQRERGNVAEVRRITASPRGGDPPGIEPGCRVYEPVPIAASEVMTPVVFTLHEQADIGQGAALMAFEGVHRLPIVADRGEVVGMLSALDVLRWLGRCSGYLVPPERRR